MELINTGMYVQYRGFSIKQPRRPTTTITPVTKIATSPMKMIMKGMQYKFGWKVKDPESPKEESDGKVVSICTPKSSYYALLLVDVV